MNANHRRPLLKAKSAKAEVSLRADWKMKEQTP
jgi:hypothetical protein